MSLRPLLGKELRLTRRNLFLLGFLLVALPAFFVGSTVVFQETVPRDVPVAVVAGDETVSGDELAVVGSGLALFTEPTIVESRELALERLERERVYAIVEVPGGLFDPERAATVSLTVDGSIVPFLDPSEVITDIAGSRLSGTPVIEGEVTTERVVRGEEKTLPEYLFPVFLFVLAVVLAFAFVPADVSREAAALDRLRTETSLGAVLGAKLLYYTGLLIVPLAVFKLGAVGLGYDIRPLAPLAVLGLGLAFVTLASLAMTITILTKFRASGRFLNVVALLGTIALSGLAFPVGFFSSLRTTIARLLPTHYAMILVRSGMLKGAGVGDFLGWVVGLAALAAVCLGALAASAVHYRRTSP